MKATEPEPRQGWLPLVFGKDQPEYIPLPALLREDQQVVFTKWELDYLEREAIRQGADVYLTIATGGKPLQPVKLEIGKAQ